MPATRDIRIEIATAPEDFDAGRALIQEYADWLGVNLCFQDYEAELAALDTYYRPPKGRLYLARADGAVAGCMAIRALPVAGEGELKRLYVRPAYRGLGIARLLMERTIAAGRDIGYRVLRFDTWPERMPEPQAMYRRFGFVETPPYYNNPVEGVIFMKLDLE